MPNNRCYRRQKREVIKLMSEKDELMFLLKKMDINSTIDLIR